MAIDRYPPDLPHSVVVPSTMPPNAVSGSITHLYQADSFYNSICYGDPTQNNYLEWNVYAAAGTYSLRVLYSSAANRGIATVQVNGTNLGTTIDMYAVNPGQVNQAAQITGIVLKDGINKIRFTGATKNVSASAYVLVFHGFTLYRTGP